LETLLLVILILVFAYLGSISSTFYAHVFSYESASQSFSLVTFWRKSTFVQKRVLMKLTTYLFNNAFSCLLSVLSVTCRMLAYFIWHKFSLSIVNKGPYSLVKILFPFINLNWHTLLVVVCFLVKVKIWLLIYFPDNNFAKPIRQKVVSVSLNLFYIAFSKPIF